MMSTSLTAGIFLSDDAETILIKSVAAGQPDALERLIGLYQRRVARLAMRLLGAASDVEDVIQDVFVTVLVKSSAFRGDCSVWTWLTVITLNHCRSRLRRQAILRKILPHRFAQAFLSGHAGIAAATEAVERETHHRVRLAVTALPFRDREVIVLHYIEQMTISEMAGVLRCSTNVVNVRLHRARQKLKISLQNLNIE